MVKVLLADDPEFIRRIIGRVISAEHGIEFVGQAGTLEQTVEMSKKLQPDVVVLDLCMPDADMFPPSKVKEHLEKIGARLVLITIFTDDRRPSPHRWKDFWCSSSGQKPPSC